MTKRKAVIFDIDGTLADCEHRRKFVEGKPKDWPSFYRAMSDDKPLDFAGRLFRSLEVEFDIVVVTGRPEEYRPETVSWLVRHDLGGFSALHMRKDKDYRPDTEIKAEIYDREIDPIYDVRLVVDDRASVVEMWRRAGLECWQVAEGAF